MAKKIKNKPVIADDHYLGDFCRSLRNFDKKSKRHRTNGNSFALPNGGEVHIDDEVFLNKRIPTRADLQHFRQGLLISADNQSSLDTNMLHQLQHTDLSITSFGKKIPRKHPLTSVFDVDPKKNLDLFATTNINLNNGNLIKYRATDFALKFPKAWPIDPLNLTPQKSLTITINKAINHHFDHFELLQQNDDSDLLYMTIYSEFGKKIR